MATDFPSTFEEKSVMKMVGYDMAKNARKRLFEKTGEKVEDVDVVELHDCFSANEMITYEALGLCEEGKVMWLMYTSHVQKMLKFTISKNQYSVPLSS